MLEQNTTASLIQSGFESSFTHATTMGLLLLIALTVASAMAARTMAKNKGRSIIGWVSLALAIPVLPLMLLHHLPSLAARRAADRRRRRAANNATAQPRRPTATPQHHHMAT